MKLVTKKKAIEYIEKEIESLSDKNFKDNYEEFEYIHGKMNVLYDLGILNKKELDILWNKLIRKTKLG